MLGDAKGGGSLEGDIEGSRGASVRCKIVERSRSSRFVAVGRTWVDGLLEGGKCDPVYPNSESITLSRLMIYMLPGVSSFRA